MNDYNVPGGKLNRGMAVYDVLASIKGAEVGCWCSGMPQRGRACVLLNCRCLTSVCRTSTGAADVHLHVRHSGLHRAACCAAAAAPVVAAVAQNLSEEDIFKANALGWCIEWVGLD